MLSPVRIRTIVGIVGNVISLGLFLSPVPTFVEILKHKSVQAFKPDPYIATVLNCAMWIFYGLPFVHPESILVITINSVGLGIELIYVIIFLIYSPWTTRRKIIISVVLEVVFMAIVVFVTLFFFHTIHKRSMIVGILCIIFNVIMYASPLTVMGRVIKTRSVQYMPFTLSLANLVNGGIWVAYALIYKFDLYVLIPNGLGVISGVIQLLLYGTFYRTTKWEDDDQDHDRDHQHNDQRSQVEVTNV